MCLITLSRSNQGNYLNELRVGTWSGRRVGTPRSHGVGRTSGHEDMMQETNLGLGQGGQVGRIEVYVGGKMSRTYPFNLALRLPIGFAK